MHYYFSVNVTKSIHFMMYEIILQSRLLGIENTEKTFITSQGSHIGPKECRVSYQLVVFVLML